MHQYIEEELLVQILAFEGKPTEQVKKCSQLFTVLSNADVSFMEYARKEKLGESITPILENETLNEPLKKFLRGLQHYCLYTKAGASNFSAKAALEAFRSIRHGENLSEGNIALSLYLEGHCYECALGSEANLSEAWKCYQQAAEKQLAVAEGAAARFLENGCGIPKNAKQSVEFYKKAVAHGDADGTWRYAWYCNGRKEAKIAQLEADAADLDDDGIAKLKKEAALFEKEAHQYWKQAGMLGHAAALMNIAQISTGLAKHQYELLISMQPYAGFMEKARKIVEIMESYLSPNIEEIKVAKNTTSTSFMTVDTPTIWKEKNSWGENTVSDSNISTTTVTNTP